LWVEDGHGSHLRTRVKCCGQVVRAGGGGDDGTGRVQDGVDDDVHALARARRAKQDYGVLDAGVTVHSMRAAEPMTEFPDLRVDQTWSQVRGSGGQCLGTGDLGNLAS
jgi:hypothetical protein